MTDLLKEIKFIDLFCGLGAFHHAFNSLQTENTKYKCVYACDIDEKVRSIYKENYGIAPEGDINNIDIEKIPEFDILCGGFPCFIEGTKVLTQDGYKNIEDVILDDKLLTHTGKLQRILNLQRKIYNGDLYSIKIKYHPTAITCTEEHPFYVREKKCALINNEVVNIFDKPQWKKANELTKNDYFGMIINTNNLIPEFTFDRVVNKYKVDKVTIKLDKKEHWYMMGYFVGDGWVEDTTKNDGRCMCKIRFAINNKDETEVLEILGKVLPLTDKQCDSGINKKCKKFGCTNLLWYNIFKMFGKYAHGKLIPEWVQDAPIDFIQEFINGYMKADGCITDNNCHSITTVSYNLAFGLQRLYLKLGHVFSINKNNRPATTVIEGRIVNQRDTYCIRGYLIKERKFTTFIEDNYVWFAPGDSSKIETNGTPVYNFEVENDNSYVVENAIVHNCQPFSIAGKKEGFEDKTKGNLFYAILKIVDIKTPNTLVLENVKNLLTINKGATFKTIKEELEKRGYVVSYKVIDSKYYGSPQSRQRLFIIASKIKKYEFTPEPSTTIITPVSSVIDFTETKFLNYEDKYELEKCKETVIKNNCKMLYKMVHKITKNGGRQGERVYSIDTCGPTICASSGGPGAKTGLYYIDQKVRRLNVIESLKMFGFTENYKWNETVKNEEMLFYLGNCIVVNVVKAILSNL